MPDLRATPNPLGGVARERQVDQLSLDVDLLERIVSTENVRRAWKQVRRNGGAPGLDGMTIEAFENWGRQHWRTIRRALLNGTYRPQPVLRVEIPKPSGTGKRKLGIPAVVDRVIAQAIAQVLSDKFDARFSASSYGYRRARSAHGAVKQVQSFIQQGYGVAVDVDVEQFFDEVSHDIALSRLSRQVRDKRVLRLIGRFLRAGVRIDGRVHPTRKGLAQGSPLSPLLSNVVLDELDKELERRGLHFARYADDVLIAVKSVRSGERVLSSIARWLQKRLTLTVNAEKSQVARMSKVSFLGFSFRGAKICWSNKSLVRFKARVRQLTNRNWGVSMQRRLREFGEYLRGWTNYFGLSGYYRPIPTLDSWIRRRVRACYWVMWKRAYTRIQRLIALGIHVPLAVWIGRVTKGPTRMASNHYVQQGLSVRYLSEQGLLSLKSLWIASAPLR